VLAGKGLPVRWPITAASTVASHTSDSRTGGRVERAFGPGRTCSTATGRSCGTIASCDIKRRWDSVGMSPRPSIGVLMDGPASAVHAHRLPVFGALFLSPSLGPSCHTLDFHWLSQRLIKKPNFLILQNTGVFFYLTARHRRCALGAWGCSTVLPTTLGGSADHRQKKRRATAGLVLQWRKDANVSKCAGGRSTKGMVGPKDKERPAKHQDTLASKQQVACADGQGQTPLSVWRRGTRTVEATGSRRHKRTDRGLWNYPQTLTAEEKVRNKCCLRCLRRRWCPTASGALGFVYLPRNRPNASRRRRGRPAASATRPCPDRMQQKELAQGDEEGDGGKKVKKIGNRQGNRSTLRRHPHLLLL
jgi:hypothetical protein